MSERKRVLVVSSDPASVSRVLDRVPRGREIRIVGTMGEAVGMLFGEGWGELPALVLVDEILPDGSGRELIHRLRADSWLRVATVAALLEPEPAVVEAGPEPMEISALDYAGPSRTLPA